MRIDRRVASAVSLVVLLGAAACSSSSKTAATNTTAATSGGVATTAAGNSDAKAASVVVAPFLKPAASINVKVPLSKAPPKGLKVAWLEASVDAVRIITPGFQEAAKTLGWNLVTIPYDPTNPATANSAMQQAVTQKVNYIAITGFTSAVYASALANAKAAGIPVVQMDIAAEPNYKDKGVLVCVACDSMVEQWGTLMGNYIVADSGGKANVGYVTIPDYTSLGAQQKTLKATIEKCSGCKFDIHNSTIQAQSDNSFGGEVASYVQTHPDLTYLYFAFGSLAHGVRQAMDTAGIGKNIKILSGDPDLADAQNIIDGKETASVTLPVQEHAWVGVDAMARHSIGMDVSVTENALMPMEIWTKDNVPKPAQLYAGPQGYQGQFAKLWQVG